MTDKKTVDNKINRRDVIKGLATTPILGYFAYDFWKNKTLTKIKKNVISKELGLNNNSPAVAPKSTFKESGELVRIGIIGCGVRGPYLLRSAGLAEPSWYNNLISDQKNGVTGAREKLETYFNQSDLNIAVTGFCDVFDKHAENGLNIAANGITPAGKSCNNKEVKRYRTYKELLAAKNIDAVIIATPDFHHAQMTIDAVKAGKHVYCEKGMTLTEDEMYKVVETVRESDIVFQLGHQNSKSEAAKKANEIVAKNILGKVTLIEATTNRNTKAGAWIRHLDSNGNPQPGSAESIDWDQWLGNTPKVPFSIERYYGWARWFAYDTGLAGQLFSHEMDLVNQIMGFGVPKTVTSSGGIYFHKEERDMPDTFTSVLEFPDKEFSMLYTASLNNSRSRGRVFMGHDASMEVGADVVVIPNSDSTRYKNKIESGLIIPEKPLFKYPSFGAQVDGVTSASEKYYAARGLLTTIIGDKEIDIAHLHVKEWINAIRNGGEVGCGIEKAFQNTIALHMVHKSYVENRKVEWDPVKQRII